MEGNQGQARKRLLEAGLEEFAARGYAGASVQRIVVRAGFTKPVLYYYFGSKAGLYRALIDLCFDRALERMERAALGACDVVQALRSIAGTLFEFAGRERELIRLLFAATSAPVGELSPTVRRDQKYRRNFDFVRAVMAQGLRQGVFTGLSDEELAMGFLGHLYAAFIRQLRSPEFALDRRLGERMATLFLKGALVRGPWARRSPGKAGKAAGAPPSVWPQGKAARRFQR